MELETQSAEPLQQPAVVGDPMKETKEECISPWVCYFSRTFIFLSTQVIIS